VRESERETALVRVSEREWERVRVRKEKSVIEREVGERERGREREEVRESTNERGRV
jgi:hypothetical protein